MSDYDCPPERDPPVPEAALVEELPVLLRVLLRMKIPPEEVQDVAQEVLIIAWKNPNFDPARGSVRGWLYGIARRKAKDYRESAGLRDRWCDPAAEPPQDIVDPGETPDAGIRRDEMCRLLDKLLARLDPMLRDLIVAHEIDGLSLSETAQAFGLSENSVRNRLHRARQALKAFAAAYQEEQKLRGLVGLPFGLAVWFAAHRARSHELAQDVCSAVVPEPATIQENARRSRAAEQNAAGAWEHALDRATPAASRLGSVPAQLAHNAGLFLGGRLFGGILVAGLLWPPDPQEQPKPEERLPVSVDFVDAPPVQRPANTAAPQQLPLPAADTLRHRTPKPPSRQPERATAHDLLHAADLALDEGDRDKSSEALDRYDREFPDNPLSVTRRKIEERLSRGRGAQATAPF